jgi:tetratricopeptide (TPR) repeat protein
MLPTSRVREMRRTILIAAAVLVGMAPLSAFAFDNKLVGHWRGTVTKGEGSWVIDWNVAPNGSYHSTIKGTVDMPDEYGQLSCDNGLWDVKATSGRLDAGTYTFHGDGLDLVSKGVLTKWTRIYDAKAPAVASLPVSTASDAQHVNGAARAFYDQALTAKDAGQNERAVQLLTMAIKTSPGFVDARYQRGVCLNRMVANGQSAGQLTSRLLPRSIFGKANMIWMAIDDFNAVVARQPNNAKAICMRGLCYLESLQFNEAIADFDRAIAIDPSYSFPYGYRAIAHIDLFEAEGSDLQRAIAMDPSNSDYWKQQEKDARELRYEYKALQAEMDRKMKMAESIGSTWSPSSSSSSSSSDSGMSIQEQNARYRGDSAAADRIHNGTSQSSDNQYRAGGW